jgi:MFS family permease
LNLPLVVVPMVLGSRSLPRVRPMTMTMFASSPVGGRLADRLGARLPALLGLAITTACLLPFARSPADLSGPALIAALVGIGSGIGLATVPLQMAAIEAVDVSLSGLVSGIFSTSRYLGSIAGISLLAGPLAPATRGFGGFATLFAALTGAAAASAAIALLLPARAYADAVQDRAKAA